MTKYFYYIATLLAFILTTGCSKNSTEDMQPEAQQVEVQFGAQMPTSRAVIEVDEENGKFMGQWENTDHVTIFANDQVADFAYDAASRFFKGTLTDNKPQEWSYQAITPFVATTSGNIPFGKVRTQKGNQFNSMYDPMVSEKVTSSASVGLDNNQQPISFNFNRLTSILALTFKTSDATVQTEKVKAIKLYAETGNLTAQSFDIDKTNGTGTLNATAQGNEILLNFEQGSEPTAAEVKAFFNVPAREYHNLKALVITEKHISEEILISANVTTQAGELYYTTKSANGWTSPVAPSAIWENNPSFSRTEIIGDMTGKCNVNVSIPAFAQSLKINITSAYLNGNEIGLTVLDLIHPGELGEVLNMLQFPCGEQLQGQSQINFDLAQTISLLKDQVGDHTFELEVTDYFGRTFKRQLVFFVKPPVTATLGEIDLWKNTATVTLTNAPEGSSIQYRRSGETDWQNTTESAGKFLIQPSWTDSTNGTKILNNKTGVFAGGLYEWQAMNGGKVIASGSFGQMAIGSKIPTVSDGSLSCYTTNNTATKFWGSGNNSKATSICNYKTPLFASLEAQSTLGNLAAGNLFTGTFTFKEAGFMGMNSEGTVKFGQNYDYNNARPSALQVNYSAQVGQVDCAKHKLPNGSYPQQKGAQDEATIMVCIMNWEAQHTTTSGMPRCVGAWNPETKEGLTDKEANGLIAYGFYPIKQTGDNASLQIPLHYYQPNAGVPSGNYTIVISCASSRYGDYMSGCSTNKLRVKDFAWVY